MVTQVQEGTRDPNAIFQSQRKKTMKRSPICHSTHSFEWSCNGKKTTTITCNKPGTVKNSLRRSALFRQLEDKNKVKELVVERNGRPIAEHFPCTLLKPGERVTVKYTKASGPRQSMPPLRSSRRSFNNIVEFNVVVKGGKKITRILRNVALGRQYSEVTVYGYKGEKVKHALERDGRFLKSIFEKTCVFSEESSNVEFCNLVDDLGGKTFQIILLNNNSPPESQPSSLDESLPGEDSSSTDPEEFALQHSSDEENNNETESHPKTVKVMIHIIPDTKKLRSILYSQVRSFIEGNGQISDHNLQCIEYGRNIGSFTVEAMETLMLSHTKSVCQVRINGRPEGSGFLLFNTFVLTNYHVIEGVFNISMSSLFETVTVDFAYKSLEKAMDPSLTFQVQEVVAYEYCTESGHKRDWALLNLTAGLGLPPGLLSHCGFAPKSDTICIIGHPQGGVKKVDMTWIIPANGRNQIIERHYNENNTENLELSGRDEVMQFTSGFAQSVAMAVSNTEDLTYETCFYFGSSGSPVFDSHCNVVAMHSGGYPYRRGPGEIQSVIEYGQHLSSILENLIIDLVNRDRLDVLRQYLKFPYKHHETIFNSVKKLVHSRNYTKFNNTARNLINNDIMTDFFGFICRTDPPVPMDITWS